MRLSPRILFLTSVVLSVASMAGCAGPRTVTDEEGAAEPPAAEDEGARINHAAYETFDPTPYRDEPVAAAPLEHDVPSELMAAAYGGGVASVIDGFRIQLFQTQDRDEADAVVEQASAWWNTLKRSGEQGTLFERESAPVYNVWHQPYYRVRMGDFASEQTAKAALRDVKMRFEGAFVVPDRVTVVR